MDLTNKIVLAHKGYFDKESQKIYRENSEDICKIATTKDYIGLIELDVRKSRDGILYCYHGSLFEYYFSLRFPKNLSFMKATYNVDTLKEILRVISEDKIVVLDIKDRSVTKEGIVSVIGDKRFKDVIVGGSSDAIRV